MVFVVLMVSSVNPHCVVTLTCKDCNRLSTACLEGDGSFQTCHATVDFLLNNPS